MFRGFVAAFEQCKIPKPRPHPTRRRDQGVQQVNTSGLALRTSDNAMVQQATHASKEGQGKTHCGSPRTPLTHEPVAYLRSDDFMLEKS